MGLPGIGSGDCSKVLGFDATGTCTNFSQKFDMTD